MGVILSMYHNLLSLFPSFFLFLSFSLTDFNSILCQAMFFWQFSSAEITSFSHSKKRKKGEKERKHNLNDIPIHVFQKLIEIFLPPFSFYFFFLLLLSLLSFLFAHLTLPHVYSLWYTLWYTRKKDKEYSFIYFHSLSPFSLFSFPLKNFLIEGKER